MYSYNPLKSFSAINKTPGLNQSPKLPVELFICPVQGWWWFPGCGNINFQFLKDNRKPGVWLLPL